MPAAPRRFLAVALAAASLALAGSARAGDAGDAARGPEVVRLDLVPGRMGAVTFKHGAHAAGLRRADGALVSCRDCHHDLPAGDGGAVQRCLACHAALDEPPRAIPAMGGKVAPALVQRKEDRALDYKTVLFHAWCRDCHKKSSPPGKRLHLCKVCHERGVGQDVMHGDPAAQDG